MTYRLTGLAMLTLFSCSAAPGVAEAQTAQDMIGSWAWSGTRVDVYGADPQGIQIFDSGGAEYASPAAGGSLLRRRQSAVSWRPERGCLG